MIVQMQCKWAVQCDVCHNAHALPPRGARQSDAMAWAMKSGWKLGDKDMCPDCRVKETQNGN